MPYVIPEKPASLITLEQFCNDHPDLGAGRVLELWHEHVDQHRHEQREYETAVDKLARELADHDNPKGRNGLADALAPYAVQIAKRLNRWEEWTRRSR